VETQVHQTFELKLITKFWKLSTSRWPGPQSLMWIFMHWVYSVTIWNEQCPDPRNHAFSFTKEYTVTMEWLDTGFGLVIGFIGNLQLVITSNYSALPNSRTLQFTAAFAKSPRSAVSSPVVPGNGFQQYPLLPLLPAGYHLTTNYSTDDGESLTFWTYPLQSQSQSYFTTGGSPPISLSWRQASRGARPKSFFFPTKPLRS
jgi:hypothetical protein